MAAPAPKASAPHAASQCDRRPPAPAAAGFTDMELEAAVNLVMLSESSSMGGGSGTGGLGEVEGGVAMSRTGRFANNRSSCSSSSSSVPSVNTRPLGTLDEDGAMDEELTGPWARTQRYRSVADVYRRTARIDEDAVAKQQKRRRRKKVEEGVDGSSFPPFRKGRG